MTIEIYSMRISPPCRAVLMTAKQLNIDLNVKTTDLTEGENMKPEFLKVCLTSLEGVISILKTSYHTVEPCSYSTNNCR